MPTIGCNFLWGGFIGASLIILGWALATNGNSRTGSWAAFAATAAYFAASVFRDPTINRDIMAYVSYSDLARTMDAMCFLIAVRFEPLQALIIWATSNISGSHYLYFAVLVAVMVGSSALIFRTLGSKFLLFAALTFPQFGFIVSMSTIRWGAALYALTAALVALNSANFIWRAIGAGVGVMLHFGVAFAAGVGVLRHWTTRLGLIVAGTIAVAFYLPTGEIVSGSGVRYILAFTLSASLIVTCRASLKNDVAYRDHLVLVGGAAIISGLYFISPHLTRFAVSLLFISYLPLVMHYSPLTTSRVAIVTLLAVPGLALGLEVARPSCEIWGAEAAAGPQQGELAAGALQYNKSMSFKEDMIRQLTVGAGQCPFTP